MHPANRLAALPMYFFASLNRRVEDLRRQGMDVIRMDVGSPDMPPAPFILEAMQRGLARPNAHGYSPSGGTPAFRQAVADYYQRRFGVTLDPVSEVLGLIGSKEGIFNMALAVLNPGDVALVPDPGYPVYALGAQLAQAEAVTLPLLEADRYLPDLAAIPAAALRRAKILWANYPNNPTTAVAPQSTLEQLVEFARRHSLLLCYDAPYLDVTFDGYVAPSVLQIPGAREVAIEFNSLSKTYNMAGWRLGMAVGNADALRLLGTLKSNIDSGHLVPAMEAGVAALTGDQEWIRERNRVYQERRDVLVSGLRASGFQADVPLGSLYVWARVPAGWTSVDYCSALLEGAGVSLTPGTAFGEHGEGYVRLSLGVPVERARQAMQRLDEWNAARALQARAAI